MACTEPIEATDCSTLLNLGHFMWNLVN